MSGLWTLLYHFVFNFLNAKNDYRLFKIWMKLTLELPAKSKKDYKVAGLSQEENQSFWLKESNGNQLFFRAVTFYSFSLSLIFSSQLFFVRLSTS